MVKFLSWKFRIFSKCVEWSPGDGDWRYLKSKIKMYCFPSITLTSSNPVSSSPTKQWRPASFDSQNTFTLSKHISIVKSLHSKNWTLKLQIHQRSENANREGRKESVKLMDKVTNNQDSSLLLLDTHLATSTRNLTSVSKRWNFSKWK